MRLQYMKFKFFKNLNKIGANYFHQKQTQQNTRYDFHH